MALLTPRQRAAIVLRYYEDLSQREAAQILGCSVGAFSQLIVRLPRHASRERREERIMNELERNVRDMFERHERDLDGAVFAPDRLVHRVRRRQIRNASVGVITAVALIAVASAALVRLANVERPAVPNPTSRVAPPLGAANVGEFTFTVPNGWFLSSYSDHAKGPVVGLSNFAPSLTNADPCTGMPNDGALLLVDPAVGNGGHAPAWPVELQADHRE